MRLWGFGTAVPSCLVLDWLQPRYAASHVPICFNCLRSRASRPTRSGGLRHALSFARIFVDGTDWRGRGLDQPLVQ